MAAKSYLTIQVPGGDRLSADRSYTRVLGEHHVYKAVVEPCHVLALCNGRPGEHEVVVDGRCLDVEVVA